MKQQTAQLNYLRIAPRKVRLVANLIKGMQVAEAEAQLLVNPKRAAESVLKLLRSAVSNAKNGDMSVEKLVVKEIRVNEGPVLKRFMPRAQGRATSIHKKSSHITLILEESEKTVKPRFKIVKAARVKKSELEKMKKVEERRKKEESREEVKETLKKREPVYNEDKSKDVKIKEKPSIGKRMFRRKAMGGGK